jgi:hypothetical protein
MERSRVKVEYSHLHQQVFEHEAEGVHCVVQSIDGGVPELLTKNQALDAIQTRLEQWQGEIGGFVLPLSNYADSYRLVVPATVEWDLWPRVYACDRCGRVFSTDDQTELRRICVQTGCGGTHRQLPYFRVHRCGARSQIGWSCPVDPSHPMRFHDTGSFYTAAFSCTVCNTRREIIAGRCGCNLEGLEGSERNWRLVRARDSKSFYPHHVTVVNISARLARVLNTPRGSLWALAHYFGAVTELDGLIDEAQGRQTSTSDDETARMLREMIQEKGGDPDKVTKMLALVDSTRGQEPGLDVAKQLTSDPVLENARDDRRLFERAFIFHEHKPDDVDTISNRYRATGHSAMAARMEHGVRQAEALGFSRVSVIRQLPIALVGFGFTREFPDHRAKLMPLEAPRKERNARRPLVAIESNTEAIFFELSPMKLWSWAQANGWTTDPQPNSDAHARAWVTTTTYAEPTSPAALAIQRLTHAWSHTLIHALEGRSAFAPNSVAEYLMERTGSFFIYVSTYSAFNLGGLTTLAEQHLADWMEAAREQTECVHDPVCLTERGGCHKCLALAFHCERFNRGLHRGYLVGTEDGAISAGWLQHASQEP